MQRLRMEEAEEVVRLAAARQAPSSSDGPTVEELAYAMGLPVREVERLLAEVRATRHAERRFGDRSAALSAALVLAITLVVVAFLGLRYSALREPEPTLASATPLPPSPDVLIETPEGGQFFVPSLWRGASDPCPHGRRRRISSNDRFLKSV